MWRRVLRHKSMSAASTTLLGQQQLLADDWVDEYVDSMRSAQLVAEVTMATSLSLCDYSLHGEGGAHERSAQRLKALAQKHGGLVCKFGQHVASLHHAVPPEYVAILSALTDKQPASDPMRVRKMISRDVPGLTIDPEPIASASVAQVHRGYAANGEVVAVKVMHPGLERRIASNLDALRLGFWLAQLVFPRSAAEWKWLIPEFEDALRLELDFLQEAANAERASAALAASPRGIRAVRVPRVYWEHTSTHVLTTGFVDNAHRVDDCASHLANGLDPKDIGARLVSAVASLAYEHGLVHADPHGGNALVQPDGTIWLLDHGLYRRLNEETRLGLCELWDALARGQPSRAAHAATALGLGTDQHDALFVARVLFTSAPASNKFGDEPDAITRRQLKAQVRTRLLPEASARLRAAPRDLLFAFRSASLLRGLHAALGGSRRDRYLIFATMANRGLAIPSPLSGSIEGSQQPPPPVLMALRNGGLDRPHHSLNRCTASERLRARPWLFRLWVRLLAVLRVASLITHLFFIECIFSLLPMWFWTVFRRAPVL